MSAVTGIGEEYIKRNFTITPYQIFGVIRTRKMRWEGHVEQMGGEERFIWGFGGEI